MPNYSKIFSLQLKVRNIIDDSTPKLLNKTNILMWVHQKLVLNVLINMYTC